MLKHLPTTYEIAIQEPESQYGPAYDRLWTAVSGFDTSTTVHDQIAAIVPELAPNADSYTVRLLGTVEVKELAKSAVKPDTPEGFRPRNVGHLTVQHVKYELADPQLFHN
ncbi:MAG: hypothetical protein JWN82_360 [Candidatus Saccharibacteria bacterium]|nr:hypothetical protein [Candidatus Saccharibacteria bacterium]